ncbi:membrane protein insertase YidC [Siccirubricoccus deserti]|uniref:Membrane protein insertase YidC n=1 Tax=Siccirubricoccus deserti TaxID=2013562 RepID=A0A9X0R174_9PROT|nr:membrane protein insertase YidC [Siccirubricoccus deserti]MBC4016912.1 membrane protein insertase YidC [Siccirubricoccus deserti]GGC53721.1 membrane protein insertase YidC [Siccirubricoccus deserti]
MDNKRLLAAIAISIGILLTFELFNRPAREAQLAQQRQQAEQVQQSQQAAPRPVGPLGAPTDASPAAGTPRAPGARLPVDGPKVQGTISLRGARLDDLVLRDYHETVDRASPLVRLLAPREGAAPYYAQWGWTAADGRTPVPGNDTDWQAEGGRLAPGNPVTLRWDNGQGQVFEIGFALDENYMFTAEQRVRNTGAEAVQLLPWARIRRESTPPTQGFYILHEGFVGVLDGRLREMSFSSAKDEAGKRAGTAFDLEAPGGWSGFTDKYWLTALAPVDQSARYRVSYRAVPETGPRGQEDRWQVDYTLPAPVEVAPGATAARQALRLFAGAKEVHLLDAYRDRLGIPDFDKAVDFGWFYFLTKPFFHVLHFLGVNLHNFGVAILVFTLGLKILFFPLANKAYKSMSRMKVLGPKMQEIRERHKDDPAKAQAEMMALYRTEKINPASGCLPILIQIPVFFALYKVLFVTIEMRHAPFFGWIHDLSAPDPTNLFNLFGLIPWDPMTLTHYLHMPAWALIMGVTMYLQQKLNPQPPDPIQAKIFQWMPVIFTFMLASFPAGLVIYWSWNNLLSIGQQWYIMHMDAKRGGARPAVPAPVAPPPAAAKPKKG